MDDPARPYKTYAGVVLAFLMSILADQTLNLPLWVEALLVAVVAGLGVYITPNPKSRR